MQQLDLFASEQTPDASPERVLPHVWPELVEHISALPAPLRLGTSSWSFPGWLGLLYASDSDPKALSRHGLSAYASHGLRTVSIDSGYYAPVPIERLRLYAGQVPDDFRFLLKAPAAVTDAVERASTGQPQAANPGFLDAARAIDSAVQPLIEGLGERAGTLLFQFPPLGTGITANPRRFAEQLYRFLHRLPGGPSYAVEIRDAELLTPDLVEALRHGGASAVYAVHPRLPGLEMQRERFASLPPGPCILRWMLRPDRGYTQARQRYQPFDRLHEPDPDNRKQLVTLIIDALAHNREVMLIANNKAEGCAPLSLLAIATALRDHPQLSTLKRREAVSDHD